MSSTHARTVRLVSTGIMVAGLGWVAYLLGTTLDHPSRFIPDSSGWLTMATFLLAASMTMSVFIFHAFLDMQDGPPFSRLLSARLFLTGQLLRYLPGRIWGVVYQVGITREHFPATRIVRVNLDMMVFMLIGNSLVSLLLLGYRLNWSPAFLIFTALTGFVGLVFIFLGGANWLVRLPINRVPDKISRLLLALSSTRADPAKLAYIFFFFSLGWVFYVTAWSLLAKAYPVFAEVDFVALCAFYTLASLIGILSAITPAGLGVREAAFIVLASAVADLEVLAFFAVFGRIWLLVVELTLMLCFLACLLRRTDQK